MSLLLLFNVSGGEEEYVSAIVTTTSTVTGSVSLSIPAICTVAASSSVSSSTSVDVCMTCSIDCISTVDDIQSTYDTFLYLHPVQCVTSIDISLVALYTLTSSISCISNVSGRIAGITPIIADISAISECNAPTLCNDISLVTSSTCESGVAVLLVNTLSLISTVQCISSVSDIQPIVEYYITPDSTDTSCVITTSLSVDRTIIGLIGGAASLSQHIVVTYSCVSSLFPASECTAGLSSDVAPTAAVTCESTISGILDRVPTVAISISCVSSVAGSLSATKTFAASIDGVSAVDGQPYTLYIYATYTPPEQFIEITWEGT